MCFSMVRGRVVSSSSRLASSSSPSVSQVRQYHYGFPAVTGIHSGVFPTITSTGVPFVGGHRFSEYGPFSSIDSTFGTMGGIRTLDPIMRQKLWENKLWENKLLDTPFSGSLSSRLFREREHVLDAINSINTVQMMKKSLASAYSPYAQYNIDKAIEERNCDSDIYGNKIFKTDIDCYGNRVDVYSDKISGSKVVDKVFEIDCLGNRLVNKAVAVDVDVFGNKILHKSLYDVDVDCDVYGNKLFNKTSLYDVDVYGNKLFNKTSIYDVDVYGNKYAKDFTTFNTPYGLTGGISPLSGLSKVFGRHAHLGMTGMGMGMGMGSMGMGLRGMGLGMGVSPFLSGHMLHSSPLTSWRYAASPLHTGVSQLLHSGSPFTPFSDVAYYPWRTAATGLGYGIGSESILPFQQSWEPTHRGDAIETVMFYKNQKQLTFQQIAQCLGRSEAWTCAALLGQASLSPVEVETLMDSLSIADPKIRQNLKIILTQAPLRSGIDASVDPVLSRFAEVIQAYGTSIKALINEKFGEGCMSADVTVDLDKEKRADGEYIKVTLNGKFLPYKKW